MEDLVLVVVIVAFVALCVGYIGWCDRIIEPDSLDDRSDAVPLPDDESARPVEVPA